MTQFEHNLVRVQTAMDTMKRALSGARQRFGEGLALTRTQLDILLLLAEQPYTTGDLAKALFLTQSAITQTIDTMVRQNLVVRLPAQTDRRVVSLGLSTGGEELAGRVRHLRRRYMEALVTKLTDAEVEAFVSITEKMTGLFNESAATQHI